jgi:hypothetical protein
LLRRFAAPLPSSNRLWRLLAAACGGCKHPHMFAPFGVENTQNRDFMLKSPFSGIFAHFHQKRLFGEKSKATHKLGV